MVVVISPDVATAAQFWAAIATIALVGFAGVELWREKRRDARADQRAQAERTETALVTGARLGHLAYELRDALETLTTEEHDLEEGLLALHNAGTLDAFLASLATRFNALALAAAEATPEARHAALSIQVSGLAATRSLRAFAAAPDARSDMFGRIDARSEAEQDVQEAITALGRLISPGLLSASEAHRERRRAESMDSLFGTVAEEVVRDEEREAARARLAGRRGGGPRGGTPPPPDITPPEDTTPGGSPDDGISLARRRPPGAGEGRI